LRELALEISRVKLYLSIERNKIVTEAHAANHEFTERGLLRLARAMMLASEIYLAERIRKGIRDGDMPSDINIEALAAFVNALVRGLAVQARDGASREKLLEIGRVAMEAWPVASKAAA
jgi:hypothetical protein